MTVLQAYRSQFAFHDGVVEQSFLANFVAVEREEAGWLIGFGDLLGDDALGSMRPPIHSLLIHVDPEALSPLSIEFNDQSNTCEDSELESLILTREGLRIRVKPGTELWSGRVTYVPSIDPFLPDQDPQSQPIRGVHVTFACVESKYEEIGAALAAIRANWLHVGP